MKTITNSIKSEAKEEQRSYTILAAIEKNTHILILMYGVGSSLYIFANNLILEGIIHLLVLSFIYYVESKSNKDN